MWDQNVQNREGLKLVSYLSESSERLGIWEQIPSLFVAHHNLGYSLCYNDI